MNMPVSDRTHLTAPILLTEDEGGRTKTTVHYVGIDLDVFDQLQGNIPSGLCHLMKLERLGNTPATFMVGLAKIRSPRQFNVIMKLIEDMTALRGTAPLIVRQRPDNMPLTYEYYNPPLDGVAVRALWCDGFKPKLNCDINRMDFDVNLQIKAVGKMLPTERDEGFVMQRHTHPRNYDQLTIAATGGDTHKHTLLLDPVTHYQLVQHRIGGARAKFRLQVDADHAPTLVWSFTAHLDMEASVDPETLKRESGMHFAAAGLPAEKLFPSNLILMLQRELNPTTWQRRIKQDAMAALTDVEKRQMQQGEAPAAAAPMQGFETHVDALGVRHVGSRDGLGGVAYPDFARMNEERKRRAAEAAAAQAKPKPE
ncbi:MAG: hypothetical protein AB7G06_06320 [Bdellovibrionales bacterium]